MYRCGPSSWCCNVKNSELQIGPLTLDPARRRAAVASPDAVIRVRKEDAAALAEVETLVIPGHVRTFLGLSRFPALRVVSYDGDADVFGFGEGAAWLAEKAADPDGLMQRLATNMLAAPPISGALTAVIAPHVPPLHAAPSWRRLLDAIHELAECSNGRQDSSRQNVCLCRSFAQLKQLEYAQYMGFALSEIPYPEETASLYVPENCFSPREQLVCALSLPQAPFYQEVYTADGPHGYTSLRTKDACVASLQKRLVLTDGETLPGELARLLDAGLLNQNNYPAAVDLLLEAGLPAATAWLLEQGERRGWSHRQTLDEEFAL